MQPKNATRFRQYYNALLDLLLPQQCPLCQRFCFDHGLCVDCWQELAFIIPPFAYALGGRLPMPLAIIFVGLISRIATLGKNPKLLFTQ